MSQSEAELEEKLIKRLTGLGYERVRIDNADALIANLKRQLEIHNVDALDGTPFSEVEFSRVLNRLDKGNVFERAKILRDKPFPLTRDDGSICYIEFLNCKDWCQNQYQVTHQVSITGKYKNRYDVTLLINGLPLVQIELKRRGLELKEAFNQINRYQKHTFWAEHGLFQYLQIFVISNGVNTKYFANNYGSSFKQSSFWADENNRRISQLDKFADHFLEKCHVSKMIAKYTVLHESDKILMVLRPYQFYAVEALVKCVKESRKNGYIWHTTGSGKTLTSFKASQILVTNPDVHKVVFVVDRADLDYQTSKEFNAFSEGCVDDTTSTKNLVKQLIDKNPLIVTTIQKLNHAIRSDRYTSMNVLRDKRIVFIFDECHRSQFGETHHNIVKFFENAQLFGFTGTPIFADNAISNKGYGKRTTRDLFGDCLHKYLITNAIADQKVLKFSIEYMGKITTKDGRTIGEDKVASIDTKAFFEGDDRINKITNWVIANHYRKTHNKKFTAMMCVSSIDCLIKYYDAFQQKKKAGEHDLRIVTIFSYGTNEDDLDADGRIGEPDFEIPPPKPEHKHTRDKLAEIIADYNEMYEVQQSIKDSKAFYTYYRDIGKRVKGKDYKSFKEKDRADILLVVNMFLTGFDAKHVNTLYVDKNLKYHGLIQAFSRTNRILSERKSQGNIICFRNLKDNADEATALFSDGGANESIFVEPYESYVEYFNEAAKVLFAIVDSPEDVDLLISEDDQANFVHAFRRIIRIRNTLKSFSEFHWSDLHLGEQEFLDFQSKYLDIYYQTRSDDKEAVSIIDDIDFELELIHRDEVNVAYILKLLAKLQSERNVDDEAYQKTKQTILDMLATETQLRSKKELIEKFIEEHLPSIGLGGEISENFSDYWSTERGLAIDQFCEEENLDPIAVEKMIAEFNFSGKEPLREPVFSALLGDRPKLRERKLVYERIVERLLVLIETFEDNTGDL